MIKFGQLRTTELLSCTSQLECIPPKNLVLMFDWKTLHNKNLGFPAYIPLSGPEGK